MALNPEANDGAPLETEATTGSSPPGRRFEVEKVFAWATLVITSTGVYLSLLGYGVALAAESTFGIPHAMIVGSTFDLLELSFWGSANLLTGVSDVLSDWGKFGPLLWSAAVQWVVIVSVLLLVRFVLRPILLKSERRSSCKVRTRSPKLLGDLLARAWRKPNGRVVVRIIVVGFMAASAPLGSALLLFIVTTLLGSIPIIGLAAGESYLDNWVVGPDSCLPLQRVDERRKRFDAGPMSRPRGVQCVEVRKEGASLEGRVVFATSEAILLFSPRTGKVSRVPTDGSIVAVVESLKEETSTEDSASP